MLEIRNRATKAMLFRYEQSVCVFLKTEKMVLPEVIEHSNIDPNQCPFQAVRLELKSHY